MANLITREQPSPRAHNNEISCAKSTLKNNTTIFFQIFFSILYDLKLFVELMNPLLLPAAVKFHVIMLLLFIMPTTCGVQVKN